MFGKIIYWIMIIACVALCVFVIGCCAASIETEVETYTVGMEIIEKDFSSYYKYYEGTETEYIINARGSGEAFVKSVSPNVYAQYAVGDVVEVEVRVMENRVGSFRKEFKILGLEG
jgi:hypothetical protein